MSKRPTKADKIRRDIELKARARFIRMLDRAIDELYLAHMENNSAVLTMNIEELYKELSK